MTDPSRFLALLESSGGRLHALLTRLTLRADVAEELLQDLFVKLGGSNRVWKADDPAAYAARAAIHLAFDWRRRQKRYPPSSTLAVEPAGDDPSPLDGLVQREELEQMLRALGQLPPVGRDCLVLRYLQQEPYDAIARHLGKTPHQVRALCAKALGRLRRLLSVERPPRKETSHDEL